MAAPKTLSQWTKLAEKRLSSLLSEARKSPQIRKLGPKKPWKATLKLVNANAMLQLNAQYRGKKYATDILSFHPPKVFQDGGYLGELVICLPVLKRQARELKHPSTQELDVLLAHGILHLLGLDHEKNAREAREMARLEKSLVKSSNGLIARSASSTRKEPKQPAPRPRRR